MKEWWLQLNSREQTLVGSLGAVVSIFLFYSLVWQPLNNSITSTESKLSRQQELLAFVKQETARYQQSKGKAPKVRLSGSLSSVVNQTASQHGISITRIQPQASDIQVWIDNVSFNQLLTWLEQLSLSQGLVVKSIDLDNSDKSGEVRVRRLQLGNS